jgi:type III secretory pathway component EscV
MRRVRHELWELHDEPAILALLRQVEQHIATAQAALGIQGESSLLDLEQRLQELVRVRRRLLPDQDDAETLSQLVVVDTEIQDLRRRLHHELVLDASGGLRPRSALEAA